MKYKSGYKYQLAEPVAIRIGLLGWGFSSDYFSLEDSILYVKAGYAWDGSSGVQDTKSSMRASLVHDCLFQAMRNDLLAQHRRKYCDEIYMNLCVEDGMWRFRARIRLKGLFLFGRKAATGDPKEVLEAP